MSQPSIAASGALLNRLISERPQAINFATGRPSDTDLPADGMLGWIERYVAHEAKQQRTSETAIRRTLGQYAPNAGLIRAHLARYFSNIGFTAIDPANILITNGSQEAIVLALATLVGRDKVCLTGDPVYFGLIGAAQSFGTPLEAIPYDGYYLDRLEERLQDTAAPPVGMIYSIADYDNPTGRLMSLAERERLVDLAARHDVHIFEDAVYRRYRFDGPSLPTLKALDTTGHVLHVESFSKSVLPGLRVAGVIAEGTHKDSGTPLIAALTKAKGALSVTTAPLVLAVLAGLLLEVEDDLDSFVAARVARLRRSRDCLADALQRHFPSRHNALWPVPDGGFYMCFDPATPFTIEDTVRCAEETEVIVPPLSLFTQRSDWAHHVRLAFSNVDETAIDHGIELWAQYLSQHR